MRATNDPEKSFTDERIDAGDAGLCEPSGKMPP
jgi:hypothetical protein